MNAEPVILSLLAEREPGKTICPSEAARALTKGKSDWRGEMENVHCAVDILLAQGAVTLSWKGKQISERRGPYRIALRSPN